MSYRNISDIKPDESIPIRVSRKYPNIVKVNNIPVKYIKRIPNKYKKNEKVLVYESGEISDATIKAVTIDEIDTSTDNIRFKYNGKWFEDAVFTYNEDMDHEFDEINNTINSHVFSTKGILNAFNYFIQYHKRVFNHNTYWHYIDRVINPLLKYRMNNLKLIDKIQGINIYNNVIANIKENATVNNNNEYYKDPYLLNSTINTDGSVIYLPTVYISEIDNENKIIYVDSKWEDKIPDDYPYLITLDEHKALMPKIGSTLIISQSIKTINTKDKPDGGKYNYILRDSGRETIVTYTVKELEWKTVTGTRTPPGSENNDSYTEDIYTREEKYVDGQPTGEYRNEVITGNNQVTWKDEIEDRIAEENKIDGGPGYTNNGRIRANVGRITERYDKVTYRDYKKRKYINGIVTEKVRIIRSEEILRESVYWKMEYISKRESHRSCLSSSHNHGGYCTIYYTYTYGEKEYINDRYSGNIRNRIEQNN